MIHEEICTYEVAKLAREKGFNVQTFDWYDYTGNYNKGFIPHKLHECPRYKEYYAPTHGLLQRWLREEKKWNIVVRMYENEGYYWFIQNSKGKLQESYFTYADEMFATYELALEDALKYTLENLV